MFKKKRPPTVTHKDRNLLQQQLIFKTNDYFKSQNLIQFDSESNKQKTLKWTDHTPTIRFQTQSPTIIELNDSEDEQKSYRETLIKNEQKQREFKKLVRKKMTIGSGFSLDMSDFFKFKSKKSTEGYELSQYVSGGHITWIILFYYVCNSAIMPAWIMSIKANKILRISWRFLFQAIFMIPFVLYERRTGDENVKRKYEWSYILNLEGLKKVYLNSLGTSIWFTIILTCFQWTFISHSLMMGSLTNFFLSLSRSINSLAHPLQPGGQLFVIIGILFTLWDSLMLNPNKASPQTWQVINPLYLTRQPYQRIMADIAALSAAYILSIFSKKSVDLKTYYPPFLSILLVNIFVAIQVGLSAYFINGATFDRDTNFGVLGIFTDQNFGSFFYIAVILSFGTLISFLLISKIFTSPIIPALAMTLQPFFATFFLNLVGVQVMPGSFSIYGYIFLICGVFLILIGQFILQKQKQDIEDQKNIQKEMKLKIFQKLQTFGNLDQIGDKKQNQKQTIKPGKNNFEENKLTHHHHAQSDIVN